jgi:hypothetical protein
MIHIVDDDGIKQINNIIKEMKNFVSNPDSIDKIDAIGKNSNVVIQTDTGLGMTAKDFFDKDPEGFNRWIKSQRLTSNWIEEIESAIKGN